MSKILEEVLSANEHYSKNFGKKGDLALPPSRHFAILTCMDARIDPAKMAGLSEGDAHVIRNAGGRASDDAIRSLVISYKLLGTKEWFVIHHSDCGMMLFDDDTMRNLLSKSLDTATIGAKGWEDHGKGPGSKEASYCHPGLQGPRTIRRGAFVENVRRIRRSPLVPSRIPIYRKSAVKLRRSGRRYKACPGLW